MMGPLARASKLRALVTLQQMAHGAIFSDCRRVAGRPDPLNQTVDARSDSTIERVLGLQHIKCTKK